MSTRLLLNDNILSHNRQRGITRVFTNIAQALCKEFGDDVVICTKDPSIYPFARCIKLPRYYRGSYYFSLNDRLVSLICLKERPQVVINACAGSVTTFAKQVQMAYDMIPELFPHYFPSNTVGGKLALIERKHAFQTANLIIADSHNTARDLLKIYPEISNKKLKVIHLGVNSPKEISFTSERIDKNNKSPFFLFVGHRDKYKNFTRMLEAFAKSGLAHIYTLRVISPLPTDHFNAHEQALINQYALKPFISLHTNASNLFVNESMQQAVALIYPSEYEGFGLPILEAMASGTIVATSAISSMPEVGGDVAFYFDPYNVASIADSLIKITQLTNEERQTRIAQGIARAQTFTWQRFQQQVVSAIESLIVT